MTESVNFDDVARFVKDSPDVLGEVLYDEVSLEGLGIPENRKSEEESRHNNYGYRVIEFCKNLGIFILNGRVGQDRNCGRVTCNKSVDDIFMANPRLLATCKDFYVDTFNPLYSDKHSPVILSLQILNVETIESNPERDGVDAYDNGQARNKKPKWRHDMKGTFVENIDIDIVHDIDESLSNIERADHVAVKDVDVEIEKICKLFEKAASKAFPSSGPKKDFKEGRIKTPKKYKLKEWFTPECKEARKVFCKSHNKYRAEKSVENFKGMKLASRQYKQKMNKCYRKHKKAVDRKIRNLKSTDPKEYWKIVNPKSRVNSDVYKNISVEVLQKHFKNLSKAPPDHLEGEQLDLELNFECDVLNRRIEPSEISKAIRKLKNGKAKGIDEIGNEEIKATEEIMIDIYCKLFNIVFDSGVIPTVWSIGIIQALYKNKGDPKDPDNYRGITLLSCLGKVFTAVINNRLGEFAENNNLINKEQTGFRAGCSTIDHIFSLNCLLDIYLSKGQKIYCAFVDYKKAFDSVWGVGLWKKVLDANIKGKVIRVMMNLYDGAKSSVKTPTGVSESFACQMGVRQGENLSPFLFALFLNDLSNFMAENGSEGLKYLHHYSNCEFVRGLGYMLKLYVLLYADDTILFSDSAIGLQNGLNLMEIYCNQWKLVINGSKTKVVIFARGKARKDQGVFMYNGTQLEIVDDYTYLGVIFNYNGSFTKTKKRRVEQASKAMFGLIRHCKRMDLPMDISLELFDRMILPILLYGCEVWGFEDVSIVEKLHLKFIKIMLRVSKFTPSCMVYYESGCFPLRKTIQERMVNFWARLLCPQNEGKWCNILYNIVRDQHQHGYLQSKWCTFIKTTLNRCGLGYLWFNNTPVDSSWLKSMVKLSLEDQFKQNILMEINDHAGCVIYKTLCHEDDKYELKSYLLKLPDYLLYPLSAIRLGRNRLPGVIGRHKNVELEERYCKLCEKNDVGDEFHYLLECPVFKEERLKFLGRYFCHHPNMFKFSCAMRPISLKKLKNLAQFCRVILKKV